VPLIVSLVSYTYGLKSDMPAKYGFPSVSTNNGASSSVMATRLQHGETGAIFSYLNIALGLLFTAFTLLLGNVRFPVLSVCIMLQMSPAFNGSFHGRNELCTSLKRIVRRSKIVGKFLAFG